MRKPRWLSRVGLDALHSGALAEHGGLDGVRDDNLLESALARPRHLFAYEAPVSLARLAAAYGYGLGRNHGYLDGNKRTALLAIHVFLLINGHDLTASEESALETMLGVADGRLSEAQLADWVAKFSAKLPPE